MGRPVFSLKETDRSEYGFIGFSAPLKYAVKSHNCNLFGSFDMANVLFVLLETCTVNLFCCFVVLRPRKHLRSCRDGQLT